MADDVRLMLSTDHRAVLRATRQRNGCWAVSEVPALSILDGLRHATAIPEARQEYKAVARAALPPVPAQAVARLDSLQDQHRQVLEILTELRGELTAESPRTPPPS